jgi:hypothetical protein
MIWVCLSTDFSKEDKFTFFIFQVTNLNSPDEEIQVWGSRNETENVVQFFTIVVDRVLQVGAEYEIYIEFVAPISTNIMNGLYLSTYTDPDSGLTK